MGENILPCKIALEIKRNSGNTIEKNKPQVVPLGCRQNRSYYDKIFSPVVDITTIRLAFGITALERAIVHQFYLKVAFVYGTLKEKIYMEQPKGFENPNKPDHIY